MRRDLHCLASARSHRPRSHLFCPLKLAEFHERIEQAAKPAAVAHSDTKIIFKRLAPSPAPSAAMPRTTKSKIVKVKSAPVRPKVATTTPPRVATPVVISSPATKVSNNVRRRLFQEGQTIYMAAFSKLNQDGAEAFVEPLRSGVYSTEEEAWKAMYHSALDEALNPSNHYPKQRYVTYAEQTAGSGNFQRRARAVVQMLSSELPRPVGDEEIPQAPSLLFSRTTFLVDVSETRLNEAVDTRWVFNERAAPDVEDNLWNGGASFSLGTADAPSHSLA